MLNVVTKDLVGSLRGIYIEDEKRNVIVFEAQGDGEIGYKDGDKLFIKDRFSYDQLRSTTRAINQLKKNLFDGWVEKIVLSAEDYSKQRESLMFNK